MPMYLMRGGEEEGGRIGERTGGGGGHVGLLPKRAPQLLSKSLESALSLARSVRSRLCRPPSAAAAAACHTQSPHREECQEEGEGGEKAAASFLPPFSLSPLHAMQAGLPLPFANFLLLFHPPLVLSLVGTMYRYSGRHDLLHTYFPPNGRPYRPYNTYLPILPTLRVGPFTLLILGDDLCPGNRITPPPPPTQSVTVLKFAHSSSKSITAANRGERERELEALWRGASFVRSFPLETWKRIEHHHHHHQRRRRVVLP